MTVTINDIEVDKKFNVLLDSSEHVAEAEVVRTNQFSKLFTTHPKYYRTLIKLFDKRIILFLIKSIRYNWNS